MKTISFVIPIYNEETRLNKTFKALKELKLPCGLMLEEVIFVDDGSIDSSKFKVQNAKSRLEKVIDTCHSELDSESQANPREVRSRNKFGMTNKKAEIKLISYYPNKGKGQAVKTGMLASKSDYTLFFDADMSTPLSEINKFMKHINNNVDVIVGTRKNGKSTVVKHQPLFRELLGRTFTLLTKIFLNVWITDFTCGFKAFSYKSKEKIFESAKIQRWGYDAEILFLSKKIGFSMEEAAVLWANDERTKVNLLKDIPYTLYELVKINWIHYIVPGFALSILYFKLRYRKVSKGIATIITAIF